MTSTPLDQGETLLPYDRRKIQTFYKKPPTAKYLAIVSTGLGRTNNVSRLPKWINYLSDSQQYAVLLYNYPGLGQTSVPNLELTQAKQIILDLEYLVRKARGQGWSEDQIFLIGISVGTGPTLQLLKSEGPKYRGIMLFSPYMTPTDMAGIDHELQEFFTCTKDQIKGLESHEAVKEVALHRTSQDITIVVGMNDATIDPEHGAELYGLLRNTPHTTRFIRINGASHAAVRTVAKELVQPILRDPSNAESGEKRCGFKQTAYGSILSGVSLIHSYLHLFTSSLRK